MTLCKRCLSLDIDAILKGPATRILVPDVVYDADIYTYRYQAVDPDEPEPPHEFQLYHDSPESLHESSKTCDLCRIIWPQADAALDEGMTYAAKRWYSTEPRDQRLWACGISGMQGLIVLSREPHRDEDDYRMYQLVAAVGFCVGEESPLASRIEARKIPASPMSSPVIDRIRRWMRDYAEPFEHTSMQSSKMPNRVLEIGLRGETVALDVSGNITGDYAALSHCWGLEQATKLSKRSILKRLAPGGSKTPIRLLTQKSMRALQKGVKTRDLPKSFQDAVWLTYELGLRYLWIDSLCIIQGDDDDWSKESACMCDVYHNAAVTIAASRATDSSKPFLDSRTPRKYADVPYNSGSVGGNESISAFLLPLEAAWDENEVPFLKDEPLTERGWALQERYLSQRTIHFTKSQIYFEVGRRFSSEDGWFSYKGSPFAVKRDWLRRWFWCQVVEAYTMRKLTFGHDKLPAIAGLAPWYEHAQGREQQDNSNPAGEVRYLAGLWSDDLIWGLTWEKPYKVPPLTRPQEYRAPSWSWASLDGVIKCPYYNYEEFGPESELAVVQEAQVDLESPLNPFGKVTGGWIHLKVVRLRLTRSDTYRLNCRLEEGVTFGIDETWDSESYRSPTGDAPANSAEGETELFAAPLAWEGLNSRILPDLKNKLHLIMLLLKPTNQTINMHPGMPAYQRVGVGFSKVESSEQGEKSLAQIIVNKWAVNKEKGLLESVLLV